MRCRVLEDGVLSVGASEAGPSTSAKSGSPVTAVVKDSSSYSWSDPPVSAAGKSGLISIGNLLEEGGYYPLRVVLPTRVKKISASCQQGGSPHCGLEVPSG